MAYAERTKGRLTGRWFGEVDTRHPDGTRTRVRKPFRTMGEAEGFEAYVKATGDMPPHMLEAPSQSFAAVAAMFSTRNKKWLDAHDGHTNAQRLAFAVDHLGKLDVKAIRKAELYKYVDTVKTRAGRGGKAPANRTVNYYLHAVSKVLKFAHGLDMVTGMPEFPYEESVGAKRGVLSWAQEDAVCGWLTANSKGTMAYCVRLLAGTGMRRGELFNLTPEQIEGDGIQLSAEQTKTKVARWVPLVPQACTELRALVASGALPEAARLYDGFKAAAKSLGESEALTLHCLRHTAVTRLLDAGAPWLVVAEIVGHKAGVMTGRYYHPDKATLLSWASKVQIRLGETEKKGEVVAFERSSQNVKKA